LCLGTLVVIWGIFSQKKSDGGLSISPHSKLALLTIALFAVIVLALQPGRVCYATSLDRDTEPEHTDKHYSCGYILVPLARW